MRLKQTFSLSTVALVLAVLSFFILGLTQSRSPQPGSHFVFAAPEFVTSANAAPVAAPIADRLDQEAGISAWYQTPDPINIAQVAPMFRTIETQTTDYIIGSVAVPNYVEHFDVHVYAHRDGWILAYYFKTDLLSKIIHVKSNSITTTNLETVVSIVAGAAGAPFTQVNYYDFRYPNATNMLMVAEDTANGSDFTINLPSTYGYFERGWAAHSDYSYGTYTVDGANAAKQYRANNVTYGPITSAQLLPGTVHTISVNDLGYGVMIILYRVP